MTIVILLVAVAAAARGTWSPCGLSMLSTITPIGERGRGNRYGVTAAWYVAGGVAGGLCLGGALAAAAWMGGPGLGAAGATALLAMASDLRSFGFQLPVHMRQVNERWLDEYRPWVYGGGFGWQVGTGFATAMMTSANYLLVVLVAVRGSMAVALLGGLVFGTVRGLAVLLARNAHSADALLALHTRVHRLAGPAQTTVVGVELLAAVVAAAMIGPWALALTAVVALPLWLGRRAAPVCHLDTSRGTHSRQT